MEFSYSNGVVKLPHKELTVLDRLVLDFVSRIRVNYVIVSGYVAILFGRSRSTEDIDMFIKDDGKENFSAFYDRILSSGKYWALNAQDAADAYDLMTAHKSSLRFAEKGTFDPNFEIKFAGKETDFYSLSNAWSVDLGVSQKLRISPMELEIAYKLYLGSEKDFDDAAHLYAVFREVLDKKELKFFLEKLRIKTQLTKKILDESI
jgi:hypothetical protein